MATITCGSTRGPRPSQEDRFCYHEWNSYESAFIAVMDGHGGAATAEFVKNYIGEMGLNSPFPLFPPMPMPDFAFIKDIDEKTRYFESGSTLSAVMIHNGDLWGAVIGDSPIIVIDWNDKIWYGPDHNVRTNPEEAQAAKDRGGSVFNGYVWSRGHGLQMSRALGDANMRPVITSEPEIFRVSSPKAVLVCSDGLVDPAHTESAARVAELLARGYGAYELLADAALKGLQDNATAVVWRA